MPILVTGAHHFLAPDAASDLPAICLRQIFILAEEGGRGLLGRGLLVYTDTIVY